MFCRPRLWFPLGRGRHFLLADPLAQGRARCHARHSFRTHSRGREVFPWRQQRAVMLVEIDKDHGGSDRGSRLVPLAAGLLFLAAWFVFVVLAIQLFT